MSKDLPFRSVNWSTGMLLTPEQFLDVERYVDEIAAWPLQYLRSESGLVGGGVRWVEGDSAIEEFNPAFDVDHEDGKMKIGVSFVRGITPSGRIIEVRQADRLEQWFTTELAWNLDELFVSVVSTGDKQEDFESIGQDTANENQPAYRHPAYALKLVASPNEIRDSLVIGRLRIDSRTREYQHDDSYIPPAAFVLAHSRLYRAWQQLQQQLETLALGWAAAFQDAANFVRLVEHWQFHAPADRLILSFCDRCSFACEHGAYGLLDPVIPPQRMFQMVDFVESRVGVAMQLVANTREFRELVPEVDHYLGQIAAVERPVLSRWRGSDARRDLSVLVDRAQATLGRIQRLLTAVRERYVDYRLSRVLGSMDFIVDLTVDRVFAVAQRASRTTSGEGKAFVFSGLETEGAGSYRVVLIGDPDGEPPFDAGSAVQVTLTQNHTAGAIRPTTKAIACDFPLRQRNFGVDHEVPEGTTFSSLRVEASSPDWFQQAVLFRLVEKQRPRRAEPPATTTPEAKKDQPVRSVSGIVVKV